jgi:hypothetical protein
MLALVVVEGFAILLLGLLVVGLLHSHAEILRALHELGANIDPDVNRIGSSGPVPLSIQSQQVTNATAYDITGTSLDDEIAAMAIVGAPRRTLLAFLTSGCATCENFWAAFKDREIVLPGNARLVIVVKDAGEENATRLRELAPPDGTLVLSSSAWADYQVPASPYFVYVDGAAGRVIGEGAAASWPQVAGLLRQAIQDTTDGGRARRAGKRPPPLSDADRTDPDSGDHIDRELLQAGIGPGHPSLYAGHLAEPSGAADRAD